MKKLHVVRKPEPRAKRFFRLAQGGSPGYAGITDRSRLQSTAPHESFTPHSTGLMSTTGVPSMVSIGPTRNRVLTIFRMLTGCNPMGWAGPAIGWRRPPEPVLRIGTRMYLHGPAPRLM